MTNHSDIIDADSTAIVPVQHSATAAAPRELYRVATDIAGICRDIVIKTSRKIGQRDYVCVEGWQAIATAHGCMLSIDEVSEDADSNVIAIASVRRMSDGMSLARAEGFVGTDEKMWAGRQRYARRAMAQTRAMSRAARSAFAHVVVLIDAGLSTTPAEEMFGTEDDAEPPPPAPPPQRPPPPTRRQPQRSEPSPKASPQQVARVIELLNASADVTDETLQKWFTKAGVEAWEDMPADAIEKCIGYLSQHAAAPADAA